MVVGVGGWHSAGMGEMPSEGKMPRRRVVVVGGGISGLSAGRAAVEAARTAGLGEELEVLLLERSKEVGGKVVSRRRDGYLVEGGPTGFLDNEPILDRLVEVAGLEKLPAEAASARRFLVRAGKLREVQAHPLKFAASGILSPLGLLRLAREAFVPGRTDDDDETIWKFAERRLGRQAAERLIAPMVLGVFAGDARKLSLPAAFPRMRELEMEHGSLLRAMRKLKAAGKSKGGPAGPGATLTSFADGLQALPLALARKGGFEVRTGVAIDRLIPRGKRWELQPKQNSAPIMADAVVLAAEPWAAAPLLPSELEDVAKELRSIECPAVSVVSLGFGDDALARVPRGFGALIPRGEGFRSLGVLWDTHLFAGRSPQGTLLLRVMLGGAVDPAIAGASEAELVEFALADLARLHGLKQAPIFKEVTRWPRAIPQYVLGHRERVKRIESSLQAWHSGGGATIGLAGNALDGVAFGKAAARGWHTGQQVVDALAAATT